ncbi:hypothetical protein GCK72_003561 [Caenorhabditis remanei]|uniref:Uncharacterized protein n=1 Tax=Caenorhabditis remanei TaxID=31234 RepID=A0A6A5HXK7_CAERE|nr:hypothetical protein GCK72_003561 [Caenorhabditis remanei]KAF1771734.1 hypothetical protein GCK72_003561 [Caenorhabditis remanei]
MDNLSEKMKFSGIQVFSLFSLISGCFSSIFSQLHTRNGGSQCTTPVDQSIRSVDSSRLVHPNECLCDSTTHLRIHREHSSIPVDRRSQLAELIIDDVSLLVLPMPHLLIESVTSQIVTSQSTFTFQSFLDDDLCGDSSVITSWIEECSLSMHSIESSDRILDSRCQRVSDMKSSCHIWRWDTDDERLRIGAWMQLINVFWLEVSFFLPPRIPRGFYVAWRVCGWNIGGDVLLESRSSVIHRNCSGGWVLFGFGLEIPKISKNRSKVTAFLSKSLRFSSFLPEKI